MGAIVGGIEDAENRAYFTTSFDGMSEGVRTAIYQQLALPEMGYVREASKDQFKWFSGSGEGAELAEEWGGQNRKAMRNIGIVIARVNAALGDMTPSQDQEFRGWYNCLPMDERCAVLRAVVMA